MEPKPGLYLSSCCGPSHNHAVEHTGACSQPAQAPSPTRAPRTDDFDIGTPGTECS
ncbi:rCG49512 [Rattus norvegicus]|uniref:RCG49512 n=1 Tax=Rattus norvegicus TaxID=10116 RepID=A6J2I6_RAT|nr:rCG49512 [Rattus norvegicus]